MSKLFSQLLLHSPVDRHPRTWICVKGTDIPSLVKKLEKDVLNVTGQTRWGLSEDLASKFRCSHNTIEQIFRRKRGFYPVPIVLELAKLNSKKPYVLRKFDQAAEYLKVNSASAKPVRCVSRLSKTMAKIIGAFMADGSLSMQVLIASPVRNELKKIENKLDNLEIRYSSGNAPSRKQYYISVQVGDKNFYTLRKIIATCSLPVQTHYNIELTDMYRDNVEAFNRWIWQEFRIQPTNFGKKKNKNAWRTIFSNKVLARYLIQIFDITPGLKTYSAREPSIIQKSPLYIRRAFARGVLMFDGCVTMRQNVVFATVSEHLFHSIKRIWEKDGIKFWMSINRRDEYNIGTNADNPQSKLLAYFEENTQKRKLLHWLSGNVRYKPAIRESTNLSTKKIMNFIRRIKKCDVDFLKNHFGCTYTTMRYYVKILKNQGKINLSARPNGISIYISPNAAVFIGHRLHGLLFRKAQEIFAEDRNFAKFLNIHKATLSAWKLRKNRIPIHYLRTMCPALHLDFEEVLGSVKNLDREIVELI